MKRLLLLCMMACSPAFAEYDIDTYNFTWELANQNDIKLEISRDEQSHKIWISKKGSIGSSLSISPKEIDNFIKILEPVNEIYKAQKESKEDIATKKTSGDFLASYQTSAGSGFNIFIRRDGGFSSFFINRKQAKVLKKEFKDISGKLEFFNNKVDSMLGQ